MTVLVVCGGLERDRRKVLAELLEAKDFRAEMHPINALIRTSDLIKRYHFLFPRLQDSQKFWLINGVESDWGIDVLREVGAVFCHVRGPLAPVFKQARIQLKDLHVAPSDYSGVNPDSVLDPIELLSECEIRRRKQRSKRA